MSSLTLLTCLVFVGLPMSSGYPVVSSIDYFGVACEGDTMEMFCPPGFQLVVTSAEWGRDDGDARTAHCDRWLNDTQLAVRCPMRNVLTATKIICDGKRQCDISTKVDVLGDTCPADSTTNRFLKTAFTCTLPVYKVLACEASGTIPLECPPGQTIEGMSAFYGRDTASVCPHSEAIKRTNCSSTTATNVFKELCDKRQRCEVKPLNMVFGDTCPGTYKYLWMKYSCVECRNVQPDGECEYQALRGACESNPLWMIPNCRKTCTRCDGKAPKCVNHRFPDANCTQWADENQCVTTPDFMLTYCRKACGMCDPKDQACRDVSKATSCKYWASTGECYKTPEYMTNFCLKSCSNCEVDDTTACQNLYPDDRCLDWVDDGECYNTPLFMLAFCRKACTNCDGAKLNFVGHYARPGRVEPGTAEYTVILADEFPTDARLTHFSAFFASTHTISLEIWRPKGVRYYYDLVYSIEVKPMTPNMVQTVPPKYCVPIQKGDRVGFTSKHGTSPIAFHFNMAQLAKRTAFRTVGINGRFDELPYPYVFSVGAAYDTAVKCQS